MGRNRFPCSDFFRRVYLMIQRVSPSNAAAFEAACAIEPIYGSKCLSGRLCYGDDDPAATFWVGLAEGTPSSAMMLSNGVLTCSSDSRLPPEELLAFLQEQQVHELDTNREDCLAIHALAGGSIESSYYMYYRKDSCPPSTLPLFACQDLRQVFSVLQQSHEFYRTHYQYDTWSADLLRRIHAGATEVYQLDLDGQPVGTGMIVSEDDRHAVLAAVAVIPAYRHRGIGSEITRFLVNRILEKGKIPCLISGYDAVAELYRQVGFQTEGRWGEWYR